MNNHNEIPFIVQYSYLSFFKKNPFVVNTSVLVLSLT